jgi:hypothetical protein
MDIDIDTGNGHGHCSRLYSVVLLSNVVDDNLVDTKNMCDCQANTEETLAGIEFWRCKGRTEFIFIIF